MTKIETYDAQTGITTVREALPGELPQISDGIRVPQRVTRAQARMALIIFGGRIGRPNLQEEVDNLVNSLPGNVPGMSEEQAKLIQAAWWNSNDVNRSSPALQLLFPMLGLTLPEQLDEMFIIAGATSV